MNQNSLQECVALITGAGRPPAGAIAAVLAAHGAVVAANDLSPTLLDPLVQTISAQGGRIQAYIADATRGMPLRAMVDEILSDWGRIDILINNPRIQPTASLLEMDEWDWQRTIEMNLNGPFLVTQIAARLMREQGGGVIINIVDAEKENLEQPGHGAYAASQQGLLALSEAASRELMAYNIRVFTLCPNAAVIHNPEQVLQDNIPGPDEVFPRFAAFLCSPEAASITGQTFYVRQSQIIPRPEKPWQSMLEGSAGGQE